MTEGTKLPNTISNEVLETQFTNTSLVEASAKRRKEIVNADPANFVVKNELAKSILKGELTFRDALGTIRDLQILNFNDPDEDIIGHDGYDDDMRFWLMDSGSNLAQLGPTPSNEAHYIINNGVSDHKLRLPTIIAATKIILNDIEKTDYSSIENGNEMKKQKIERISGYLYALTDFQTDLITDELVQAKHPDWVETRKKISKGEEYNKALEDVWNDTRKKVVEWNGINSELQQMSEGNKRLRSVLQRPALKVYPNILYSPLDSVMNTKQVKAQQETTI